MNLDLATRTLQIVLTAAKTTADMPVIVHYEDQTTPQLTNYTQLSKTNGTSVVTILSAPNALFQRKVKDLSVCNQDTAAKTVQIGLMDNATLYPIISATLQIGDTLGFTDTDGWYTVDASGNRKLSLNPSGQEPTIGWGGTSTGSANAQVISPVIPVLAYAAGQKFQFKAGYTNSGATTLAVSALGTVAVQINGNALVGGEIVSGKTYTVLLDSASTAQLQFYSESYIEGTFTGTLTGCTSSPTVTINYVKIGKQITLCSTGYLTATSNAATKTITGVPTFLNCSGSVTDHIVGIKDNSAYVANGIIQDPTVGVLYMYTTPDGNGFTQPGTFTVMPFSITSFATY